MSKIFLEILDTARINLLSQLVEFKTEGYLAGGTALALQIGHRRSVDFDIFIEKAIDTTLRTKIKNILKVESYLTNTSDQITFKTKDNISVTFLWYYFPRLKKCIETKYVALASIEDIAADKAMTIGRRAVWRDYVDIYFLLEKNIVDLKTIMSLANKKFGGEFVNVQFLEQLVYFDDIQVVPIEYLSHRPSSGEIKLFLQQSMKEYMKQQSGL